MTAFRMTEPSLQTAPRQALDVVKEGFPDAELFRPLFCGRSNLQSICYLMLLNSIVFLNFNNNNSKKMRTFGLPSFNQAGKWKLRSYNAQVCIL